jgi:hypothetical protein
MQHSRWFISTVLFVFLLSSYAQALKLSRAVDPNIQLSLTASPSDVNAGQTEHISFTIQSDQIILDGKVVLSVDFDGSQVDEIKFPGFDLIPNVPWTISFPWKVPASALLGSYTVNVKLVQGRTGKPYSRMSTNFIVVSTATNGQCGASNGETFTSVPTANLCTAGTATAVGGAGPWNWSCAGTDGGTTAQCTAQKAPVSGQCGTSSGETFSGAPTLFFCSAGTATDVTGTGPWIWCCAGSYGGTTAQCSAQKAPVNGQCGSSSGGTYTSMPITNLCTTGTASPITGNGPWNWSCIGGEGGTSAPCFAQLQQTVVNGQCGTSSGGIYTIAPSLFLCSAGTATSVSGAGPWSWSCTGSGGGTAAQCTAQLKQTVVNGQCGASSGGTYTTMPTSNLCTMGTASPITGSGPWNWSCIGSNGGTTTQCFAQLQQTAVNGGCGSANNAAVTTKPTANLCSTGTASSVVGAGPWTWSCAGSGGGTTAQCSAPLSAAVLDGVCGSANNFAVAAIPTANLCSKGTATTVSGAGPWSWSCTGLNGGTTASCSAPVGQAINGSCGSANGGTFLVAPATNLCNTGGAGTPSGTGPWMWACWGSGGGTAANCKAQPAQTVMDGACGPANGNSFASKPTAILTSLYNLGTPSTVSGTGPWNWSCQGAGGGSSAQCSAQYSTGTVDGTCGAANKAAFLYKPASDLCIKGAASTVTGTGPWSWSCAGTSTTAQCSASLQALNGQCGSANRAIFTLKPTTWLCNAGTASAVTGTGPWNWSCTGNSVGTTDQCTALASPVLDMGICGTSNGQAMTSAPSTGLCKYGTASAITGSGPWSWSCTGADGSVAQCSAVKTGACLAGSAIPATPAIILPPATPQPSQTGDIVGVIIQNPSTNAIGSHFVTFGQMFIRGQVAPTDNLVARTAGNDYQVQMDAESLWPDGSVKLAAITMANANICSGQQIPAMLAKTSTPGSTSPVSLTNTPITLIVDMEFSSGQGTKSINLGTALKLALASNPDYWLHGPLATQARVDVPVSGIPSLHLTADVTAYADGTVTADVQFNNDLTSIITAKPYHPPASLPPLVYTTAVSLQGVQQVYPITQQYQFQDWHAVLNMVGSQMPNVQRDVAYLEYTGAILPYDRKTGFNNSSLQTWVTNGIWVGYSSPFGTPQNPLFGEPLSANGLTQGMPNTGARSDIGWTTMYNTVWLLTQDARAAKIALLQGDSDGAVPWNYKLVNGRWATPYDSHWITTDSRADITTIANLPNYKGTGWSLDTAHQPNLAYVPYLMTAQRWYLDRLNAQAANALTMTLYSARCKPTWKDCDTGYSDIVINFSDQVRAQAWNMREVMEAGFIGKPGTWDQQYFAKVAADNWEFANSQASGNGRISTAYEGEAAGYISFGTGVQQAWMQDYMSGVAVLGGLMGDTGAQQWLNWQKDKWLTGRILGTGMNPYDACNYTIATFNSTTKVPYQTWAEIEAAEVAAGTSKGTGPFLTSGYCDWYRGVLGGALTLFPGDSKLKQALDWLNTHVDPKGSVNNPKVYQGDPTWNVVPLQ